MVHKNQYDEVPEVSNVESYLNRERINNLLKSAIEKPVTLVTAGAGYGKTQAVSTALRDFHNRIIWLQLSEFDNLAARLWEHFIYSVNCHNPELGKRLTSLDFPQRLPAFDQFLRLITKELIGSENFIFVFDDLHFIHNKKVLDFFERLIFARVHKLSIVIISRTNPDLGLAGMLSKGGLAKITEDDLRFSRDEMEEYYRKQGAKLSQGLISQIYSFTEGWMFAIYLIGLSMKAGNIYDKNPILLTKLDIFELVEREIFQATSKELQNFLIKISIFDTLPIGLVKELSNDNAAVINEMISSSLFIRYDNITHSFRLHNLFREFLLEKANRLAKGDVYQVQLTAAKWYESNHFLTDAISHYKACGCYNEIFDIILSIKQRVVKDTADSFINLIEFAPKELMEARPIMLLVKANYLLNNNRIHEAHELLLNIRNKYEALPAVGENQMILGEAYLTLALISIINQEYEFEDLFNMANQCLPKGSQLIDSRFSIAEGINVTGIKKPVPGELDKYRNALFQSAGTAAKVMNGCGYGMEYLNAADSDYMTGNINHAEKNAYEAIYRARQYEQYDVEYMANFILMRIYLFKGDYPKIATLLQNMKEQLDILQNSQCIALYDMIEGWFYVKIGQTEKVCQWIMNEEETQKMFAPLILGREYLVHSDCLLGEDRYNELLAFMGHTDKLYESRGILYAVIQNYITKSIIYHYSHQYDESIKALQAAYELSSPNNLIIQYIEYGSKMRTVISAAQRDKNCGIPKEWLSNVYTKSSTYAKNLANVVFKYMDAYSVNRNEHVHLSKREMEILLCLCNGLTRDEIADHCHLSVNTVKSMLNTIYSKLGAQNPMEAVRIAAKMDIL
ncbi:helix-turn-helix transcriptional regulator [Lacrimispora brassicae]